jgi:hypothetical protein
MQLTRRGRIAGRNHGSLGTEPGNPSAMRRLNSSVLRIIAGLCVFGAACGCHEIRDGIDDKMIASQNRRYATQAWKRSKDAYDHVDYYKDFRTGFCDGYFDVAMGGNGCQPALPPRDYWGAKYQNPEGQHRIMAWFNGYSHGALAAQQDGIAYWNRLPTPALDSPYPVPDPAGPGPHIEEAPSPSVLPPPPLAPVPSYSVPPDSISPPPAPPVSKAPPGQRASSVVRASTFDTAAGDVKTVSHGTASKSELKPPTAKSAPGAAASRTGQAKPDGASARTARQQQEWEPLQPEILEPVMLP